eukprot:g13091.t1
MHDDIIMLLLLKHQLLAHGQAREPGGRQQRETVAACLPETKVLVDLCRKHYALVARRGPGQWCSGDGGRSTTATATVTTIARVLVLAAPSLREEDKRAILKQLMSMTLKHGCPAALAEALLAALVALADRDPAKILQVYGSRLCFYCDSQSDPFMQDQVVEVGGMIRALEHFTRVLFTGGQSDVCAQFLYADLSSSSLGASPFSPHLSEEDLNGLLCGRKGYPHVAQLINGCLVSKLPSVRCCAYETLANVALFAKEHRGAKAFDMLLRLRLKGVEKDARLVAVLAALAWEILFVDQGLQEERLVGSGAPGSYALLDDLFAESVEVRLVAFHSLGRLLFHAWIPAAAAAEGKKDQEERDDEDEEARDFARAGAGLFPLGSPPSPSTAYHGTITNKTAHSDNDNDAEDVSPSRACAEQALLRLSLILNETASRNNTTSHRRRSDSRVRAAARGLVLGLRSRRRPARHMLARSALLVLDHGLANGALDGLRLGVWGARGGGGGGGGFGSRHHGDGGAAGGDGGQAAGSELSGLPCGSRAFVDDPVEDEMGWGHSERSQMRAGQRRNDDRGRNAGGGALEAARLSTDALQYASAVHFLVAMLSREDQESVTLALESRLADYFDGGDDDGFWGAVAGVGSSDVDDEEDEDWPMNRGDNERLTGMGHGSFAWDGVGGGSGSGGGGGCSCGVDASAAAAWLAGGGGGGGGGGSSVCNSLLEES